MLAQRGQEGLLHHVLRAPVVAEGAARVAGDLGTVATEEGGESFGASRLGRLDEMLVRGLRRDRRHACSLQFVFPLPGSGPGPSIFQVGGAGVRA